MGGESLVAKFLFDFSPERKLEEVSEKKSRDRPIITPKERGLGLNLFFRVVMLSGDLSIFTPNRTSSISVLHAAWCSQTKSAKIYGSVRSRRDSREGEKRSERRRRFASARIQMVKKHNPYFTHPRMRGIPSFFAENSREGVDHFPPLSAFILSRIS